MVLARSWEDLGLGKVLASLSTQAITEVQFIPFYLFCMYREFNVNSTLNSHNILVFYQIQHLLCHHHYYEISYLGVSTEHFRILY